MLESRATFYNHILINILVHHVECVRKEGIPTHCVFVCTKGSKTIMGYSGFRRIIVVLLVIVVPRICLRMLAMSWWSERLGLFDY